MFDIDALEAAGFEKILSAEEWEATNRAQPNPRSDYYLRRGLVMVTTEQNTSEQSTVGGISTTVRYPEIAIVHHAERPMERVTCDASDTELILLLAEELGRDNKNPANRKR
jgi:hypothetical protein